jgi:malate synthase
LCITLWKEILSRRRSKTLRQKYRWGQKSAMKKKYIKINNLSVSSDLLNFINNELLKDTTISPENFWKGFDKIVHELSPINRELIKTRDELQKKIDVWHIKNKGNEINIEEYKKFLKEIGYLKEGRP